MTREEYIKAVKDCGKAVIDNAEKIYNDFKFSTNGVEIRIVVGNEALPVITVIKEFLPEQFVIDMAKR